MTLPIAIHDERGSFSDRWIAYCEERGIAYTRVDCRDSNIVTQLRSVNALLWHWHYPDPVVPLIARQIVAAAEAMDLVVFPNSRTCWHYDDKIGQKYLLEALHAALVPTYVFFELREALQWIDRTSYPKVFKLRTGAGSANVQLVKDAQQARRLARQAFANGFRPVAPYLRDARKRLRVARQRSDVLNALRRLPRSLAAIRRLNHSIGSERGYIYFQDFAPGNEFDIRVTIIGDRAFGFTRNVRPHDFRASGSGDIAYDLARIPLECVRVAFDVTRKIGAQSLAFDFVLGARGEPMILEVSYCYQAEAVFRCEGHWDRQLNWHPGHVWPQDAILIDLLEHLQTRNVFAARPAAANVLHPERF
jgi:glutathione synthase/RimK-type ligase-like ATP-grasp enzyme